MNMKKHIIVLLLLTTQTIFAQNGNFDKLDSYFDALEQNNKFMGSISIFKVDKEIFSKSVGFANMSTKTQPNKDTKYSIGSISKTFTATMIFQAVESGKLRLNQTLDSFFPTIANAEKITIANMLQHRSGIYNYTNTSFPEWNSESKSRQEMITKINAGGSTFEPNEKLGYSNANYLLLSYILEDVYEDSFAILLNKMIIEPLGLKNTTFGELIDKTNNCAYSYVYLDKWRIEDQTASSVTMGAGGIFSTPYDLNIFTQALFSGTLISENSLNQMMKCQENVGMGLFKIPFYTLWGYGHSGGIDGFNSLFVYFADSNISYSIVSNALNCTFNDINIVALSAAFNKPFNIPNFKLTPKDLDSYLGVYSSSNLPIKLTISKNNNTLIAQGTGQAPFNLTAINGYTFEFKQAGVIIEFKSKENSLVLKQGGGIFLMKKELPK